MPEWFVNLAYITLTVLMILFLGFVAFAVILATVVGVRDWLDERKVRKHKCG